MTSAGLPARTVAAKVVHDRLRLLVVEGEEVDDGIVVVGEALLRPRLVVAGDVEADVGVLLHGLAQEGGEPLEVVEAAAGTPEDLEGSWLVGPRRGGEAE